MFDGDECVHVLLIGDQPEVRAAVKLLEDTPGMVVIGEAANGTSGVRLFAHLVADYGDAVVVTDLDLPDLSGGEVARQIKALHPAARVLLLAMQGDAAYLRDLLDAGAEGYVLKQAIPHELVTAIRSVVRGEIFLSPPIARWLMGQLQREFEREHQIDEVTVREREVLRLLAGGRTGKETAQCLGLSVKTVEYHRTRLLGKLRVSNTAAAISAAFQQGLL